MRLSFKRNEYTRQEQEKILDFIVRNKSYNVLRGNMIWKKIEEAKIVDRSWQSCKEHFRMKIIKFLHIFYNITPKDRDLIKKGWKESSKTGKQIKRLRLSNGPEESNNKSSDSSDLSDSCTHESVNAKRKKCHKTSNKVHSPLSSDKEEEASYRQNIKISDERSNKYSPNLRTTNNANKTKLNIPTSSNNGDKTPENILPTNSSEVKNTSIQVDSDSDTVVVLDTTASTSSSKFSQEEDVDFSKKEDLEILQFMRRDHTYLKERNELRVYKQFCELHYKNHPKKSSRQVRRRFLNYIFPNIYKFKELTYAEKCLIYVDADAEIPVEFKKLIGNVTLNSSETQDNSDIEIPKKTTSVQQTQTNFGMNVGVHTSNKRELHCIYCNIELNGECHLFVSSIETEPDKEKLITILTKGLKIQLKNIHFVDFSSYFLLELTQNFRNAIVRQFGATITNAMAEDSFTNINIERVISALEICIQPFLLDDDNSTPQRQEQEPQDIQDITGISNIKEENNSFLSWPNIPVHLDEHNYSAPQISALDNQNNS